jgi:hypothetical protein
MRIKISRLGENLNRAGFLPSAREANVDAILAHSTLAQELSAAQLTQVARLMQSSYQAGLQLAGAEKIDIETVWVNGVGLLERMPDGTWQVSELSKSKTE